MCYCIKSKISYYKPYQNCAHSEVIIYKKSCLAPSYNRNSKRELLTLNQKNTVYLVF